MADLYVDANNQIVGRLAVKIAKEALKGNNVYVLNSEHAVISGNPEYTERIYKEKVNRGDPYHGPFYPKMPERILKRIVRGMLPKKTTGRQALKRIKTFRSMPEEFDGKKLVQFKEAENKLECKYITLGELSKKLGSNYEKRVRVKRE
jgi:large subunit ribosomal protein L13